MQKPKVDFEELRDTNTTVWRAVDVEPTIIDQQERLVEGRINTDTIDAYNSIVEPSGAILDDYKNYASVLFNHHSDNLIGNAVEVKQTDNFIDSKWQFLPPGYELADYVWRLYKDGWLNGYSIGFVPMDWDYETIDDVDVVRVTEWELKEFSLTSVPANPEALARNGDALQNWEKLADRTSGMADTPLMNNLTTLSTPSDGSEKNTKIHAINREIPQERSNMLSVREVVSYQDLPIEEDDWDADEADARVREWAGGPDKEDIDWDKYFKAFLWRDGEEPEKFGSYKLGYADVYDGKLRAVDSGIYAIAAVLEGARGGVDIPESDEAAVRNQVEKYYDKMDETAPWNEDAVNTEDNKEVNDKTMDEQELVKLLIEALEERGLFEDSDDAEETQDKEAERIVEEVGKLGDAVENLEAMEENEFVTKEEFEELETKANEIGETQEDLTAKMAKLVNYLSEN